jgi:POT family proton-dependent oligopeptide transporter
MQGYREAQPKGLSLLFFTELWERFGFYTLQTILVLYMSKVLDYSDNQAYLIYGIFSAMLYLTPVFGGYLADRWIGFRQSVYFGGFLFILGYLLLVIPGVNWFFSGLSLIMIANGLFKPSVSSLVGELYNADDTRRERGFTIFYMGINVGSMLPPLMTGAIVLAYGWHVGFLLAAIGIVIGMIIFLVGRHSLGSKGGIPVESVLHQGFYKKWVFYLILTIGLLCLIPLFNVFLMHPKQSNWLLGCVSIGVIAMVLYHLRKEHFEQRRKLLACLILTFISIGFWAIAVQMYTSAMFFADRNMSKEFLGFTINAQFTQFFNPFFIIVLSPFMSWMWFHLDRKKLNPTIPAKFAWGTLFMSIGYLLLGGCIRFMNIDGIVSPWWLVMTYFFQTVGELLISPIGLAMIAHLSPRHLVGMMMGVWFLSRSAAFAIGGGLATLADIVPSMSMEESLSVYSTAFFIFGIVSLTLAGMSAALVPYLKRLIMSRAQ